MGRKPKYATLSVYQPYIDIICKDLGIPSLKQLCIVVKFNNKYVYQTGEAYYDKQFNHGYIEVYKKASKAETLRILLHELKHIQQYYTGKLKLGKGYTDLWEDQPIISFKKRDMDTPWEIEAFSYEDELYRLFPGLKLPDMREYIGSNNHGSKFYRIRKEQ